MSIKNTYPFIKSISYLVLFIIALLGQSCNQLTPTTLPKGFVYLNDIAPTIKTEVRYYGSNNFAGTKISAYNSDVIICTEDAAKALKKVQKELLISNLELLVYDAYRPQRAVNHFIKWAEDLSDTLTKSKYYPDVAKKDLFRLGYIAEHSSHSRGSTFDLTIINHSGNILDMGSDFDFFGSISWIASDLISDKQRENRMLLNRLMTKYGFKPYDREWWHFTLKPEPFPDTYFDFAVE